MDLSASLVPFICQPTGAFLNAGAANYLFCRDVDASESNTSVAAWSSSPTNPAKRVNSLQRCDLKLWKIDGVDGQGTRFLVRPLFIRPFAPKRIDVFIPDQTKQPLPLRQTLGSDWGFCLRDERINGHGIAKMMLLALDHWTNELAQKHISQLYSNAPIGSKIVLEAVVPEPTRWKFKFVPDFAIERQRLTIESLQSMWKLPGDSWPPIIDISELHLLKQIHDTVSIVEMPGRLGGGHAVFKSATHGVKYLYHELKLLLTMGSNPRTMPAPLFLVTITDRYGDDSKVDGFILPLMRKGNLAHHLSQSRHLGTLKLQDQFRWAKQVVEGLQVISDGPAGFYSELKPDNLLLGDDDNIVFIDFEQMGNWTTFSAPEIHNYEYLCRLAESDRIPAQIRRKYASVLESHSPGPTRAPKVYDNPESGYYTAWTRMDKREQEAAQVYSLGKLLWCIFEGCEGTHASLLKVCRFDSDRQFPNFENTPAALRKVIKECTRGCKDWHANSRPSPGILRRDTMIFPSHSTGGQRNAPATEAETANAAQEMWQWRVRDMDQYLEAYSRYRRGYQLTDCEVDTLGFISRPTLSQVFDCLIKEEKKMRNESHQS